MTVLAEHHIASAHDPMLTESFLVVHDGTMTYDIPGSNQLAAIHVRRDFRKGTFHLDYQRTPITAFAQRWLIERGADPNHVPLTAPGLPTTDQVSRELEERLARSGNRFEIRNSYTCDLILDPAHGTDAYPSSFQDLVYDFNTWIIATDQYPAPGHPPVRVFFEDVDYPNHMYTLREGGFPDLDSAYEWTRRAGEPDNPLPPVPPIPLAPHARSDAARASSPTARAAGSSVSAAAAPPVTRRPERHPRLW
ncbi:hypothetical protein ABH940_005554 [Streptacidiphilus sp. BW17]|uniref:hypothetical protein n=1 Tax=Streptacidiphilus sp. BW17 TaxID=3156274 RepID=UPI003516AAA5